jgi:hypothetical protein
MPLLLGAVLGLALWSSRPEAAQAQYQGQQHQLYRFWYYPYYYFPHNYWPQYTPWPGQPGNIFQRPPPYMAYPPFLEPNWRYELWQPQRYYSGHHFWLDQL